MGLSCTMVNADSQPFELEEMVVEAGRENEFTGITGRHRKAKSVRLNLNTGRFPVTASCWK